MHATLLANARAAGIEVPKEVLLGTGGASGARNKADAVQPLEWDNYVAVDAEDWGDFEDEGALFVQEGFNRALRCPGCLFSCRAVQAGRGTSSLAGSRIRCKAD